MSITVQTTELDPIQAYGLLATFSLTYNESTGIISKIYFYEQASCVYYEGCLNGVFAGTQMKGSWD